MATKELKEEINGRDVFCVQWSAEKALKTKLKLIQAFGGVFAAIALSNEGDTMGAINAIQKVLVDTDTDKLFSLMNEVVSSATVDGKRIDKTSFNEIFSNDIFDFYRIFIAVLRLNYASFLPEKLGQSFKEAMAKTGLQP